MHSKEEGGHFYCIESFVVLNRFKERTNIENMKQAQKQENEKRKWGKVAQSLRFELHVVRISEKGRLGRFLYKQETT